METQEGSNTNGCSEQETRSLCYRGCGFWGTAANRGLCSKCYSAYLKDEMLKQIKNSDLVSENRKPDQVPAPTDLSPKLQSLTTSDGTGLIPTTSPVAARNQCGRCNKKVGLMGFRCRCSGVFCGVHRYPEAHACKFDYKIVGRKALTKENPVCKADKLHNRV